MLLKFSGKNLSTKEAVALLQDCPKLIGSPVSSQKDKRKQLFYNHLIILLMNLLSCLRMSVDTNIQGTAIEISWNVNIV